MIEFKDENNNLVRVAYDSKVQKHDTFISNLKARGLKYQILTLGNILDIEIKNSIVYQNAITNFSKQDNYYYNDLLNKKESNVSISSSESEDIMLSPFVATMFVNTDDISNRLEKRNKVDINIVDK